MKKQILYIIATAIILFSCTITAYATESSEVVINADSIIELSDDGRELQYKKGDKRLSTKEKESIVKIKNVQVNFPNVSIEGTIECNSINYMKEFNLNGKMEYTDMAKGNYYNISLCNGENDLEVLHCSITDSESGIAFFDQTLKYDGLQSNNIFRLYLYDKEYNIFTSIEKDGLELFDNNIFDNGRELLEEANVDDVLWYGKLLKVSQTHQEKLTDNAYIPNPLSIVNRKEETRVATNEYYAFGVRHKEIFTYKLSAKLQDIVNPIGTPIQMIEVVGNITEQYYANNSNMIDEIITGSSLRIRGISNQGTMSMSVPQNGNLIISTCELSGKVGKNNSATISMGISASWKNFSLSATFNPNTTANLNQSKAIFSGDIKTATVKLGNDHYLDDSYYIGHKVAAQYEINKVNTTAFPTHCITFEFNYQVYSQINYSKNHNEKILMFCEV